MSYDIVKAGIIGLMNALGYAESSQIVDFKNASTYEYGNTFILKCLSGEKNNDTIVDRFYDGQEWQILIAFSRSEQNDIIEYDKAHRARDAIIKNLDTPANWESFVRILKYQKWELTETPNYYVLDIRLSIIDTYIY